MEPDGAGRLHRVRSRLSAAYRHRAPAILLIVAVVNVAVLPFLPARAQPVLWRGDADLRHLVFADRWSVDLRFGFYEDLRVAAAGHDLVVPPDSIVFGYIARALADVEVRVMDYDPDIDTAGFPAPRFVGVHDGTGEVVEYAVLPGDDEVWWLGLDDGVVVIIPSSLAPIPDGGDG